jgi:hypothetical protein
MLTGFDNALKELIEKHQALPPEERREIALRNFLLSLEVCGRNGFREENLKTYMSIYESFKRNYYGEI